MKKYLLAGLMLPVPVFETRICYGQRMGEYGNMMYWDHGILFMWMIVFLVICAIVYLFIQGSYLKSSRRQSALDILEKRYALGEITKEQFINMKKDIER